MKTNKVLVSIPHRDGVLEVYEYIDRPYMVEVVAWTGSGQLSNYVVAEIINRGLPQVKEFTYCHCSPIFTHDIRAILSIKDKFRTMMYVRRALKTLGIDAVKNDNGDGWLLKPVGSNPWRWWTLYRHEDGRWTLYDAIPNLEHGIDVEDERLVLEKRLASDVIRWLGDCMKQMPYNPNHVSPINKTT